MNVYFVLYGEFEYQTGDAEASFGDRVGLGWTIGEEVVFSKPKSPEEPIKRLETVRALGQACLLQLRVSDLESMAKP